MCACSIDPVVDAVLHRYGEAADIASGLADRATAHLAARVDHDGPVVVNPTARARGGVVELTLPGTEAPAGTQLVRAQAADAVLHEGTAAIVLPAAEQVDWFPGVTGFSLEDGDGTVLVANRKVGTGQLVTPEVRAVLADLATTSGVLRMRVTRPAEVTVLAAVPEVAGFGWRGWDRADGAAGPARVEVTEADTTTRLDNGLVTVDVDHATGTFALDGHAGLGRLVDGGDCGDTYNWCPPAQDTLVTEPESVDVRVVERGPVRARVAITARYRWPARARGLAGREGDVAHDVRATVELRAGERAARVEVRVDNRSRDHRLRAHFPLPAPATGSRADCAFGPVARGLVAEGGPTEAPLPTYPAQRFVQAGGLTVVTEGVAEYELVEVRDGAAHELALTLVRATGMLSQIPMATRPLPAGPLVRVEGAQLQRRLTLRYAVAAGEVDPYAVADEVQLPLRVAEGGVPGADLPAAGTALDVRGAEVSAVVREGDALVVRVFNPSDTATEVTIAGRRGWLVDLRGRPIAPFDGSFPLRARGIATAALTG